LRCPPALAKCGIDWQQQPQSPKQKENESMIKKSILLLAAISVVGCADPAFKQYIAQRQAAIAQMPDGTAKYYAQERLDEQILAEKHVEQQRAAQAAGIIALGLAGAAAGYNAYEYSHPVVTVWNFGR
jgi:hypothetical protein